jgi:hypothetical protein
MASTARKRSSSSPPAGRRPGGGSARDHRGSDLLLLPGRLGILLVLRSAECFSLPFFVEGVFALLLPFFSRGYAALWVSLHLAWAYKPQKQPKVINLKNNTPSIYKYKMF